MSGSEILRKRLAIHVTSTTRGIDRAIAERLADEDHNIRDEIKNNLKCLFASAIVCKQYSLQT